MFGALYFGQTYLGGSQQVAAIPKGLPATAVTISKSGTVSNIN